MGSFPAHCELRETLNISGLNINPEIRFVNKSPAASENQGTEQIFKKCLERSKVQCNCKASLFILTVKGALNQGRGLFPGNFINIRRKTPEWRISWKVPPGFPGTVELQSTFSCGAMSVPQFHYKKLPEDSSVCNSHERPASLGDQGHYLATKSLIGIFYIWDLARSSFSEM